MLNPFLFWGDAQISNLGLLADIYLFYILLNFTFNDLDYHPCKLYIIWFVFRGKLSVWFICSSKFPDLIFWNLKCDIWMKLLYLIWNMFLNIFFVRSLEIFHYAEFSDFCRVMKGFLTWYAVLYFQYLHTM